MALSTSIYMCIYSNITKNICQKHTPNHIRKHISKHILNTISKHISKHNIAYQTIIKHISTTIKYILNHDKAYTQPPYRICFNSTRKQGRIHSSHMIFHLPCSFIGLKVLPLQFNLLDCSVLKLEHIFL